MAQKFYMPITSSNINRFSKFFHCQNQQKICNNISAKDPTTHYSCRYTILWNVTQAGDDYDLIAWSTLIEHDVWLPNKSLCCLGGSFNRWFINVDNSRQSTSWSTEWAKLCSIWLIAPLVSGVAGLIVSSGKHQGGHVKYLMWKLRDVTVTLNNNWGNKQVVLLLIFWDVVSDIVLFSIVVFRTLIFH